MPVCYKKKINLHHTNVCHITGQSSQSPEVLNLHPFWKIHTLYNILNATHISAEPWPVAIITKRPGDQQ